MIEITINKQDMDNLRRMLRGLDKVVPVVISRSVNKTLDGVKTDAAREITQIMNVTQATVKETMKISKATPATLSAWFRSTGSLTPLTKFSGTRKTPKGVSVKPRKDQPRTVIERALIATVKAGTKGATHTGVFWRKWHGAKKPLKKIPYGKLPKYMRLPMEQRFGPRIPDYLGDKGPIMSRVLVKADERMHKNIEHELNFELSKL